jgi:nucleoside-diphosphate-sugar epimerase
MRIVVTGAHGFLGAHICRELLDHDHFVVGIDDERAGVMAKPMPMTMHRLTVGKSPGAIIEICEGAEVIVHLAAHADVSRNWTGGHEERERLWQNNVNATMQLLECIPRSAHVVFASTGAVYGSTDEPASPQDFVYQQTSPYSASKLAGEALVQAYAFARKAPWTTFRLGCCVGAGYHHGHIADFVRKAKDAGVIHGMNDGWALRSFVHVKDVAKAVRLAIESKLQGTHNLAVSEWCPRETARVMGVEYIAKDCKYGWIGDPMALMNKTAHAWWGPQLTVEQGVREALEALGWVCP